MQSPPPLLILLLVLVVASMHAQEESTKNENLFHQKEQLFSPYEFKEMNNNYYVRLVSEESDRRISMMISLNKTIHTYYSNSQVFQFLLVEIEFSSCDELSFRVTDLHDSRFEIPHREPFPHTKRRDFSCPRTYEVSYANVDEQFFFQLKRKSTGEVIFDTTNRPLIFSDRYIEISTAMENERIYGLGDRRSQTFEQGTGQRSFWSADAARMDYGMPNQQLYGHHPVYLRREAAESPLFHIVLLRNTYGMQVEYVKDHYLTYKVIGGSIDFRFFIGDANPENVVKMYHVYINGYTLHPFWVQGYHQSRWGYNCSERLVNVSKKFNELNIPYDSLWSDIDYMVDKKDFTFDKENFNITQLKPIFNLSSPEGVHWSSIIDGAVGAESPAGYIGIRRDLFIKSAVTGDALLGWVWPGNAFFPDINHPALEDFWYEGLMHLRKESEIEQSGIWLDMNEFSNFVNGEIVKSPKKDMPPSYIFPFNPLGQDFPLETKTLSLNATHYNKEDAALIHKKDYTITQYDLHNLNGFGTGYATYKAAKRMGKQLPFILSRSTLFGSGRYMQHWTGDNFSKWEYLRASIGLIESYQIFGITMVGADICGFGGNTTPELCARWTQVGLLYPFARNHNSIDSIDQEPYAFPGYDFVLNSVIKSIRLRYSLMKFYYHLFVRGNGIGTVFRPMFFEFPRDEDSYSKDGQFFLGEYLLASPVMKPGRKGSNYTIHQVYIPKGELFFDFYTFEVAQSGNISVPFDAVCPLYIRGGKIVHVQNATTVLRSRELDHKPFILVIALDENQEAIGQMLSIDSYTDEENVVNNCQEMSCLMDIHAILQPNKKPDEFTIQIIFSLKRNPSLVQSVIINQLIVIGINKQQKNSYSHKSIQLKQPIEISNSANSFQRRFSLQRDGLQ